MSLPPPKAACPSDNCHTLSYYASNSLSIFSGQQNVSMFFLPGIHTADSNLFDVRSLNNSL